MVRKLVIALIVILLAGGILSSLLSGDEEPAPAPPGLVEPDPDQGDADGDQLPDPGTAARPPAAELPAPYTGGDDNAVDPEHDELTPGTETVIDNRRAQPVSPEPFDNDPEARAEAERELRERPALQHLPFRSRGVRADIDDVVGDGRVVIVIRHSSSKAKARQAWRAFLRRHKDSGRGYVVIYRRG